jgi:hypothetical protein
MRKFAILLVLFSAAVFSARAQLNGVTASLSLDQDQYLPGEDIQLKLTIVNRSGQPVVLGAEKQWIVFEVLGEHRDLAPGHGEMPVVGPFTLQSGQSITREFKPAPYFDFQHVGRYSVGAFIKVPQWKQEITCKPAAFVIAGGTPLTLHGEFAFGVPPPAGTTNLAPEVRRYSLMKVTELDQIKLYFRLTDRNGRTLRVFPLARMVDFGDPEAQMDRANNLHVLFQTGARTFTYCVMDPGGLLLERQFHEYADSRPKLRLDEDGRVFVGGGRRLLTWNDIPPPLPGTAKSQ